MRKKTIAYVLGIFALCLLVGLLSSCGDDLDKIKKDYVNKPHDPRLEGCWRRVISDYDDETDDRKKQEKEKTVDTVNIERTVYSSDGEICKYQVRSLVNETIKSYYYTVDNKKIKIVEISSYKKRGGYVKEEVDYRIVGGRLITPYGEYIRTRLLPGPPIPTAS